MTYRFRAALGLFFATGFATAVSAQPAPGGQTDVYHVHFTKAAAGQAVALGNLLAKPDPTAAMPDHFIVLRHQQGDDWDYCVVQHLGPKAAVEAAPAAANPGRDLRAWHTDTFVSGPSWPEFVKAMGLGDAARSSAGSVYSVAVWRAAPGHREQLEQMLRQQSAGSKVPVNQLVMTHLEGGPWQYLAVTRYNSWQDFATDQAASAAASGSAQDGWAQSREHSSYHHDTLADRLAPR